jgi:hypothetical protein
MKLDSAARLAQVCIVNSVPIGGVFLGDWSTGTALVVYWFETLLATLFTAGRIAVHRRLTHTKGHYFGGSPGRPARAAGHSPGAAPFQTFLSAFLAGILTMTVLLGLFLGLLLGTVLAGSIDPAAIRSGFLWMALAQLAGFVWDVGRIRELPFAWVRSVTKDVMGRIMLIHLGMLAGMFVMAGVGEPPAFFGTFVLVKLTADLVAVSAAIASARRASEGVPGRLARLGARLDPEGKFAQGFREHMARAREKELAGTEADEEVY